MEDSKTDFYVAEIIVILNQILKRQENIDFSLQRLANKGTPSAGRNVYNTFKKDEA